jgi:UDPglucose 6-dehydrogenase
LHGWRDRVADELDLACLSELGHQVVVRDIDPEKVRLLRADDIPIYEPGLRDVIARNKERLSFTLDLGETLDGG